MGNLTVRDSLRQAFMSKKFFWQANQLFLDRFSRFLVDVFDSCWQSSSEFAKEFATRDLRCTKI